MADGCKTRRLRRLHDSAVFSKLPCPLDLERKIETALSTMKMPFFSDQKSSRVGYLLGKDSEDEGEDLLEKSELEELEHLRPKPAPHLILNTVASIYSLIVTAALIWLVIAGRMQTHSDIIYTPARGVMGLEMSGPISAYPDGYHGDPFFGDPSPELDLRWIDHLRHATIRLSEQEFSHYNQSGIFLGDGSGYLATPTVFHDLHCLRYLHKAMYPNYYFADETEKKKAERDNHGRHCLHNLFHSVSCSADMTIRVLRWHPNVLLPSPVDHEHECMNWEKIDDWAKERYVDTAQPGLLIHPTRGEVFPGGKFVEPEEK